LVDIYTSALSPRCGTYVEDKFLSRVQVVGTQLYIRVNIVHC